MSIRLRNALLGILAVVLCAVGGAASACSRAADPAPAPSATRPCR